jgi:hypothetical protein
MNKTMQKKETYEKPKIVVKKIDLATVAGQYCPGGGGGPSPVIQQPCRPVRPD